MKGRGDCRKGERRGGEGNTGEENTKRGCKGRKNTEFGPGWKGKLLGTVREGRNCRDGEGRWTLQGKENGRWRKVSENGKSISRSGSWYCTHYMELSFDGIFKL